MAQLHYKDERIHLDDKTGQFSWESNYSMKLSDIHKLIDKSKKFKRCPAWRVASDFVERVDITSRRGSSRVRITDSKGSSFDVGAHNLYAVSDANAPKISRIETLQYAIRDFEKELEALRDSLELVDLEN